MRCPMDLRARWGSGWKWRSGASRGRGQGEHEPSKVTERACLWNGPALSAVLRIRRREDTKRPEIRRKSARDQGLERSDAWVRGSAAGGVPVLRGSGPAAWRSAGDRGARARGASGAGSERAWTRSGAGAGAAAAVSLPGLRGGAGRGPARSFAATLVQRRGGRASAAGVRVGREQRERPGSDEPLAVGGRVSARALGDAASVGRGGA